MSVWEEVYREPGRDLPVAPTRQPVEYPPDREGAGIDLSFFANIGASLSSLADTFRRTREDRAAKAAASVLAAAPILGQGVTNSSGLAIVGPCGGPSLGRQWQVRRLNVIGPTEGSATSYALSQKPSSSQMLGFRDYTETRWPLPGFYGTHEFIVDYGEKIWVVVKTAGATTQVVVDGTAEDYDLATYRGTIEL